jgi:ABC-type nitrate/sulfonate/bicarbonate transport system substrate-binding protein
MHRALFAALLGLLGLACGGPPAATGPAPAAATARASESIAPLPAKITISYSTLSGSQVAVYLAAEQGLFAKQGLTADVVYIASGTTAMQSLLAGDVQFSTGAGYEPAAAYVAGAPVRILLGLINTFPNLFLVEPGITTPEQLRGKPIGVSRLGGQPHIAARLALRHWGLNPDTDVQYLQLGGVPEILAGMQSGAVVGGVFTPPTNLRAQQAGYRVLADLGQLGIPYQSTVIVGLQPYIEAQPEVTRRFVRAILEGIQLYLTDDEASRAALAKYTHTDDPALLNATIAYYRQIVERRPYPTLAGLQTVLDEVATHDPRARTVRPQDLVNTGPLEELERAGVFAELYGEAR